MENSQIYKILVLEARVKKKKQSDISEEVQKQDSHLWRMIKQNKIKLNCLVKICNFLNLEIVIRNKEENCEYILNPKKQEDEQ